MSQTTKIVIAVIITAVVVGGGVYFSQKRLISPPTETQDLPPTDFNEEKLESSPAETSPAEESVAEKQEPNTTFKLSEIGIGTTIGEMTVLAIDPFNKVYNQGVIPWELSENNALIVFGGEITLTGDYYYSAEGVVSDEYCFTNLDDNSLNRLPKMESDKRNLWFCFSNKTKAEQLLGRSDGRATIIIDKYTIAHYPSEVWNTANLKQVLNKE